jgi:hypothetical protein
MSAATTMPLRLLAALLPIVGLGPAPANAQFTITVDPVYAVSVRGGGLGIMWDETTLLQRVEAAPGDVFWVVESHSLHTRLRERTETHRWIDGRRCPQLGEVLAGIARLPRANIAPPDSARTDIPPSDMPETRLAGPVVTSAPGIGMRIIRADYLGPVADWWQRSRGELAVCWQNEAIPLGEGHVQPKLDRPENIADWRP